MSGSTFPGSSVAATGSGVAASAAVLPFTHGNKWGTYVLITAIVCGSIVIISKVAKYFATKSL